MSKTQDGTPRARRTKQARAQAYAERAAELAAVMEGTITQEQRAILTDELSALAERAQLSASGFGSVRDFFVAAAQVGGTAGARCRVEQVLDLIAAGESFTRYRSGDGLRRWQDRHKARTNRITKELAAELEHRLTSPKTPPDYKAALADALKAHALAAGSHYDPDDLMETLYSSAEACAGEHYDYRDARQITFVNLLDLLQGLRKRHPLDSVKLRRVPADDKGQTETAHNTATITLSEKWEAAALAPFGLKPGDKLELELITGTPHVSETIVLKRKEKNHSATFGNFVEFCDSKDGVEHVWLIDENGDEEGYERAAYNLWRIKSVTRTTLYAVAAGSVTSRRERQLEALRRRLDELNDDDSWEAHCSGKRFKLEKQIYDLEREQERDEWPEMIGEAGAAQ
jgi:hypothetical protein